MACLVRGFSLPSPPCPGAGGGGQDPDPQAFQTGPRRGRWKQRPPVPPRRLSLPPVINELDGLAKGPESEHRVGGYARLLQERARKAVEFLEARFERRDGYLRALTSRGNELESISFRSEDNSRQQGNNDDLILSCCLHYCNDKAKDFMPANKDDPIRLLREVVLLTDDRNLRVKALTRNVPVRDIPTFLKWAQEG